MIVSIVGAQDREAVQSLMNTMLPCGVRQVRILNLGLGSFATTLVNELKLVHDFEAFHEVNIEQLVSLDGELTKVMIFLNSSNRTLDDFSKSASTLTKLIWEQIMKVKAKTMYFLLGNNNRGLIQHGLFLKLMTCSRLDLSGFHVAAISSIYQISKILDITLSDSKLRCYPKIDGGVYTFNPGEEFSKETEAEVNEELGEKVDLIVKIFSDRSSFEYPNIEGSTMGRFMKVFIQSNDWEVAISDDGLSSRCPTDTEAAHYGIETGVPVFLPAEGGGKFSP